MSLHPVLRLWRALRGLAPVPRLRAAPRAAANSDHFHAPHLRRLLAPEEPATPARTFRCDHAASGCDMPVGECSGACLQAMRPCR